MSTNLEAVFCDTGWSTEYDCIPLRLRSKMLHSKQAPVDAASVAAVNQPICSEKFVDQMEDRDCNHVQLIQSVKKPNPLIFATTSAIHNRGGSECGSHLSVLANISSNSVGCSGEPNLKRTSGVSGKSTDTVPYSEAVCEEKRNDVVDELVNKGFSLAPIGIQRDCLVASSATVHAQGGKPKHEIIYGFDDGLDNVLLGERRRMLVTRILWPPKLPNIARSSWLASTIFKP
ncbi:hypothetical protein KSS87_020707 [Heliosperma pusillum]|nr:hypothetical protein KSS87_020707 [Heliosperma pusillum]